MTATNVDLLPAELPEKLSLWLTNPAKIAFRLVSSLMVFAALVAGALTQWADVVPEKYRGAAQTVLVICTAIGVIGLKVTTWLTAHGYGPTANGKNGAWSPQAVYAAVAQAQTMSVRKGDHDGADLPGAPPADEGEKGQAALGIIVYVLAIVILVVLAVWLIRTLSAR